MKKRLIDISACIFRKIMENKIITIIACILLVSISWWFFEGTIIKSIIGGIGYFVVGFLTVVALNDI